jgi:hypothetical protein
VALLVKKYPGGKRGESWRVSADIADPRSVTGKKGLGSYGWSYLASNSGGAFAKNWHLSGVWVSISFDPMFDERGVSIGEPHVEEVKVGMAKSYADAKKLARVYIREHKAAFLARFSLIVKS